MYLALIQCECQNCLDVYNESMEEKIQDIKQWLGTGSINIFGIQFSGKDTVGGTLTELLGANFLSSGQIMRDIFASKEAASNNAIWEASKVGSLTGNLMPTDEFQQMITHRLSQPDLEGKPLILSTVGRWTGEEKPVLKILERFDHTTKAVILLNITEDEVWKRWQIARNSRNGGRDDDNSEEKVSRRLSEFRDKTLPVIDVYRQMGILLEVDGMQSREEVFSDTIDALHALSQA